MPLSVSTSVKLETRISNQAANSKFQNSNLGHWNLIRISNFVLRISRQARDAHATEREYICETRNSNFESSCKFQIPKFEFGSLEFDSNFEFRASNFKTSARRPCH